MAYATGTIIHDTTVVKPGEEVPAGLVDKETMDQWEEDGIVVDDEPDELDPGVLDSLAGLESSMKVEAESATPTSAFGEKEEPKQENDKPVATQEKTAAKPATQSKSSS